MLRCWSCRASARRSLGALANGTIGVGRVFSRDPIVPPGAGDGALDGTLNCHGRGSSVMDTAGFGMDLVTQVPQIVCELPVVGACRC